MLTLWLRDIRELSVRRVAQQVGSAIPQEAPILLSLLLKTFRGCSPPFVCWEEGREGSVIKTLHQMRM